jgi:hypothetical protein
MLLKVLQIVLVASCVCGLPIEQQKGKDPQQDRDKSSQLKELLTKEQPQNRPEGQQHLAEELKQNVENIHETQGQRNVRQSQQGQLPQNAQQSHQQPQNIPQMQQSRNTRQVQQDDQLKRNIPQQQQQQQVRDIHQPKQEPQQQVRQQQQSRQQNQQQKIFLTQLPTQQQLRNVQQLRQEPQKQRGGGFVQPLVPVSGHDCRVVSVISGDESSYYRALH